MAATLAVSLVLGGLAQADTTISSGTYQLSAPVTTAPSSIAGLIVQLDANNVTGIGNPADGTPLTSWANLAGGSPVGNFIDWNGGTSPYLNWTGNLMNGSPVVHFWGPQLRTTFNFQTYGSGVTVMYAGRMDGGANARLVAGGNNWLLGYHGGFQDRAYFDGWLSTGGALDYLTHIYEGTVNGSGTANFYSNGSLIAGPSGGKTRPNGLYLGGWAGSELSYSDVGELLVFDHALTVSERTQMEQYLRTKWYGVLVPTDNVTITASGATLDLNGVNQTIGSLTGVAGSHVLLNGAYLTIGASNASTTFSGDIADGSTSGGGVAKIGTGTLTLAGSSPSTYTGPFLFSQGQVALATDPGVAAIPGDILMVNSLSPTMWMTADNQLGGSGVLAFATEVNNIIGHGRINLRGTTQSVAGIQSNNSLIAGVIQNSETIGGAPSNSGASTLVLTGSGNYTFNGYLRDGSAGTLSLVKNGSGTQVFAGSQITYTGGTMINNGEIQLAGANLGRGAWVVNNGGILRGTATDSIDYIQSITVNAGGKIIQSGGSYQQFYNGGAGGTVLILNGGSVEATVAPHGNYGNFLLRGNVLVGGTQTSTISADFRMGDNADRTFTVNPTGDPSGIDLDITGKFSHFEGVTWGFMTKEGAGTIRFAATSNNNVGRLTLNAGKVLMVDQMNGWANGGITNNATFETSLGSSIVETYPYQLVGTGTFIKSGDGTLHFNGGGQVIRQGQFNLTGGILQNNNNSVNWSTNTGDMDISAGAILDLYADPVYVDELTGTGTVRNNYAPSGVQNLVVGVAGGSSTFDGTIIGGGGNVALIKNGGGTFTLTGSNTYSGTTTISNGVLQIGNGGSSGTLGTGSVAIASSGNLTFNRSDAYSVANSIAGAGSVRQLGSGTTTLTNTNTYTGTTIIDAGELIVNGSHTGGGNYFVNSGARLGGDGTIGDGSNAITVAPPSSPPGAISPGDAGYLPSVTVPSGSQAAGFSYSAGLDPNTIGTLTINGSVLLDGMLLLDIADKTLFDPYADLLQVNGNVTLDNTTSVIEINGLTDLTQLNLPALGFNANDVIPLLMATSITSNFNNFPLNEYVSTAGGAVFFGNDGSTLYLLQLPEPASIALWSLLGIGLALGSSQPIARGLVRRRGASSTRSVRN